MCSGSRSPRSERSDAAGMARVDFFLLDEVELWVNETQYDPRVHLDLHVSEALGRVRVSPTESSCNAC